MDEDFQLLPLRLGQTAAMAELRQCVPICGQYGLTLSESDMKQLSQARGRALAGSGRIEFGGGVMPKLIYAFCDSPYVENGSWTETLMTLQEAFYYYKGEAEERFTDDELIDYMVKVFNGRAQGNIEYLTDTSLEALCRYARQDWDARRAEDCGDLF